MDLRGNAAMLLFYDIVPAQVAEHDEWHTREHFPERVAIPGFIRAQRWVAVEGAPRYLVIYEVDDLDVLSGVAYRDRLDHPTPWTRRMMPHFRGMTRGFCTLDFRHGTGFGAAAAACRFAPAAGHEAALREWLARGLMPNLVDRPGIAGAMLLSSARAPEMTAEQQLRGRDAPVDWVLLVSGHSLEAVVDVAERDLAVHAIGAHGAHGQPTRVYRLACLAESAGVPR